MNVWAQYPIQWQGECGQQQEGVHRWLWPELSSLTNMNAWDEAWMSLMLNARVLICLASVSTSEWRRVITKSLVVVLGISWDKDSGGQNKMLPNVSLTWIESIHDQPPCGHVLSWCYVYGNVLDTGAFNACWAVEQWKLVTPCHSMQNALLSTRRHQQCKLLRCVFYQSFCVMSNHLFVVYCLVFLPSKHIANAFCNYMNTVEVLLTRFLHTFVCDFVLMLCQISCVTLQSARKPSHDL